MARTALNISNGDLASRAGVAVNTVSRFETGHNVWVSTANAIREALEALGVVFVAAGSIAPVDSVGLTAGAASD
jgi:transcriptional regulator with XRE-family HTH domain